MSTGNVMQDTAAAAAAFQLQEQQQAQEEGILRDVLEELDRERSRRAELQAHIRKLTEEVAAAKQQAADATAAAQQKQEKAKQQLQQQQQQQKAAAAAAAAAAAEVNPREVSRREVIAMETQVKGFQQLIDALTRGKPAIAAAASAAESSPRRQLPDHKSLPLHVVRLLEVLPWDPRAKEHIFGQEVIFEWQVYDSRERKWQSSLRFFPVAFKALPVVKPRPDIKEKNQDAGDDNNKDRNLLLFLAGGEKGAAPANHGVLTNNRTNKVLNIEGGYPLPQDGGTWQWISGWRVEKHLPLGDSATDKAAAANGSKKEVDCDEQGWSYAVEAQHFAQNPAELVWDNPGTEESTPGSATPAEPKRRVRRRCWIRQRCLVDYPYACEPTRQYLQLLAANARLTVTADKVNDQLVETKTLLTETEDMVMQVRESKSRQIEQLKEECRQKTTLLEAMGVIDGSASVVGTVGSQAAKPNEQGNQQNPLQEFLNKNEQVKEIGSKISQWVNNAARSGKPAPQPQQLQQQMFQVLGGENGAAAAAADNGFDWKKIGMVDQVKPNQDNETTGSNHTEEWTIEDAHEATV